MSGASQGNHKMHAVIEESAMRKSGNGQSSNSQEPTEARRRSVPGQSAKARLALATSNTIRLSSRQSPLALVAPRSYPSADTAHKRNTTHALQGPQELACYSEGTTVKSIGRMQSRSPLEAAPATILRQPRGPTQSQSGQPSPLSP
ncbi:hypothetical protein FB107DRAFT_187066, partial [Schizophyllum commune]